MLNVNIAVWFSILLRGTMEKKCLIEMKRVSLLPKFSHIFLKNRGSQPLVVYILHMEALLTKTSHL